MKRTARKAGPRDEGAETPPPDIDALYPPDTMAASLLPTHAHDYGELCVAFALRKAARRVSRLYEQALVEAQLDLTLTQITILAALWRRPPVPLSRFAQDLDMDRTTLTRLMPPLIDRGFVTELAGPDRRQRRFQLTESADRLLAENLEPWQRAQARVLEDMTLAEWAQLRGTLDQLAPSAKESRDG